MRGVHGHPISVGAECGDPDLITTVEGGTREDPCPGSGYGTGLWCNEVSTRQWVDSAKILRDHLKNAWDLLETTEAARGTFTESARLQGTYDSAMQRYGKLPGYDDVSSMFYVDNTQRVNQIQAWMVDASCTLEQINKAIRMMKVQPPATPTPTPEPGTGGVPPVYGPTTPAAPTPSKPFSQKLGESVLILAGLGLVGAGLYTYSKRGRGTSLGRGPKQPLPGPK